VSSSLPQPRTEATSAELAALPGDAVLAHIGMHKTGTTALQQGLADARADLSALGVCYPGSGREQHAAAHSLLGMRSGPRPADDVPAHPWAWNRLVRATRRHDGRVLVSSESLSRANPAQVRRLVDDLGADRVHVLVAVRHLAAIAVSTWQQRLKTRGIAGLDRWLRRSLRRCADGTGRFWGYEDPGATVRRWARVVGPRRLVVLVVDDRDRSLLPATVERLLDLPADVLTSRTPPTANRGMSAPEAELVRRVNVLLRGELAWPEYAALVRAGMVERLIEARTPGASEPRPQLPAWALRTAAEEGERVAREITESGVRVVGDLAGLTAERVDLARRGRPPRPDAVPADAAALAITGVVHAAARRPIVPASLRPAARRLWDALPDPVRGRARLSRRD
jgi:hypothetical protein